MIVFINGAFGVGKTTVAHRLVEQLPNSFLFDPEEVGFFLRRVLAPVEQPQPDDFQDYALWRSLVITTALSLRVTYGKTLVMPMSIPHLPYFREVVVGLRRGEPNFHHFCLTAEVSTIYERLAARGDTPGGWTFQQTERCHDAFLSPEFAIHLPTGTAKPDEIVGTIRRQINSS